MVAQLFEPLVSESVVFKPYVFAKNDPQWIYRHRDQEAPNYTENLDWLYRWRFGFMNATIT